MAKIIEQVQKATSLKEVKNIKKLSGFDNHYRMRLGDYRIGLLADKNEFN